ncbi:hypothetical protein [Micromonospora wenchangensis]|nr:hypothetical protein [Micromonospora wenchangensis]
MSHQPPAPPGDGVTAVTRPAVRSVGVRLVRRRHVDLMRVHSDSCRRR